MDYKIVIADDEEMIASGLKDLIPWQQLGYTVDRVFTDGRDIINYISENEVHVVLTDIKMTNVSGIDVARYIHENNLPIKVVLISAYNDFSLAKEAIEYNVANYLLKPTKLPEITKVFTELKKQIDLMENQNRQNIELKENSDRVEMLLRRQFFSDIYYGAIKSVEDIEKRFGLINLDVDPKNNLCCVFSIFTRDDVSRNNQIKDIRNFVNATRLAYVNSRSNSMNFYPLHQGSRRITYIAIELKNSQGWNRDKQRQSINHHFSELIQQIQAVFNIRMEIEILNTYNSLYEFMESINGGMQGAGKASSADPSDSLDVLGNRIERLIAHIRSDELDLAENIAGMICEQIGSGNIHLLRSVASGIELALMGSQDGTSDGREDALASRIAAADAGEIRDLLREMIRIDSVSASGNSRDTQGIIELTQQYVRDNFDKDIFLDSAAEAASVSPAYLSRIFKKSTGINFTQYVMNIRLEKALELLTGSDCKIYEISQQVGYANIYYFYRIFKNKYGCTPSEYRSAPHGDKS